MIAWWHEKFCSLQKIENKKLGFVSLILFLLKCLSDPVKRGENFPFIFYKEDSSRGLETDLRVPQNF